MTPLAPQLTTFLREYLPRERACRVHTCDAYAYSFKLLLCFASQRYDEGASEPPISSSKCFGLPERRHQLCAEATKLDRLPQRPARRNSA